MQFAIMLENTGFRTAKNSVFNSRKLRDPLAASFVLDNTELLMTYHGLATGYPAANQPGNPSRK
jgi:hypothetical protein